MFRRTLILVALVICAVLALILVAGELLTKPAHRTIGAAPVDLRASSVVIATADGGFVKGWLVRGVPGKGVLLLLHGVRSDRIQMLSRARFLKAAGFSSLLIDLPSHGESSGGRITFGARESEGVTAALKYLRARFPRERVGVIGVSLGAASFVLSHARPAPDAVVLESMYPTISDAAQDRIAIRLGPPGRVLAPLLLWQLPLRTGVTLTELSPIREIPTLHSPVLVVGGTLDQHTTLLETQRIFAAAQQPKLLWAVPRAGHVDLHRFAPGLYERTILSFLVAHMRSQPATAPAPAASMR